MNSFDKMTTKEENVKNQYFAAFVGKTHRKIQLWLRFALLN